MTVNAKKFEHVPTTWRWHFTQSNEGAEGRLVFSLLSAFLSVDKATQKGIYKRILMVL